jgi:hypothetical protein
MTYIIIKKERKIKIMDKLKINTDGISSSITN